MFLKKKSFFSVGSMLGLERPYISSLEESAMEGKDEFCLEYGSATHLYIVPSTLQEETVDEIPFVGPFLVPIFFIGF